MDVLEAARGVVGGLDPQELLHLRVPGMRQVAGTEGAVHEGGLELEAQDDVERVGDLVGVHADEGGLDLVERPVEVLEADAVDGRRESARSGLELPFQKGRPRPTMFSQKRDWDSWTAIEAASPRASAGPFGGQAELVEGVAGLVDGGEDGGGEIVLEVAGGDAHVARPDGRGEGMGRPVQPARVRVERQQAHDAAGEGFLLFRRARPMQGRIVYLGPGPYLAQERSQTRLQLREERGNRRLVGAGLVEVEKGVIGLAGRTQVHVEMMRQEYDRRRRLIVSGFNSIGLKTFEPQGAFYAFPSITISGMNEDDFADRLLQEEHVAVVPGTAFGAGGEGFVRACYATAYEKIEEALRRMERFVRRHG